MALKHKITKDEFEKLPDALKTEYIEDGDSFRLDVSGLEDTGALKRAKDRESQGRKDAESKLREAEDRLALLEGDDARKKGDIATLEKSWQKKTDEQKAEYETRIGALTSHVTKTLVDNVAQSIASKISTSPALLLPHIRARLTADFEGDEPKTRVLDAAGKPSAMTIDELSAEFVANKDFSAIITASKASGSAGSRQTGHGGGGAGSQGSNTVDLASMSPQQLAEHVTANKT